MMFKALCKSLTGEKNTAKAIWKVVYTAIGYISSIYAFSSLLKKTGITSVAETWVKKYIWVFVIGGIIAALFHQREKLSFYETISGTDIKIDLSVRDIFCIKANSYVIPTNTFFRTQMDGEYISQKSVQGRFQNKYFKDNLKELDRLIEDSLKSQSLSGVDSKDRFGDVKKYPIGTVAKVDHKGKHYYFVAVNDVNEYGKPVNQSMDNVNAALDAVVEAIKRFGHCDDLCTPLIGTGRAAIREATIDSVFETTVDIFIESNEKIAQKLTICISPKDYSEGRANIERLKKFLSYRCEFRQ